MFNSTARTTLFVLVFATAALAGCSRHAGSASSTRAPASPGTAAATASPAVPGPQTAAPAASSSGDAGLAATAPAAPAAASPPGASAAHPDLFFLASAALDACRTPSQPANPPAGDHATRAQMLASQSSAKAFDAATNTYLACLDQAVRDFEGQYGRALTVSNLRQIQDLQTRLHNSAVDVDHTVADRFNQQLHIFLARNH